MRISISTPNYNYGHFLLHALDNVFEQARLSFTQGDKRDVLEIEHIVVDAGSTDNSIQLLQEHTAKIMRYVQRDAAHTTIEARPLPPLTADLSCRPETQRQSDGVELVAVGESTARTVYRFRWISEPDRGQTHAINKGFSHSTGDLLCWLNADETYLDDALRTVADYFLHHPRCDIMHGEIIFAKGENAAIVRRKYDHPFCYNVLLWYGCYLASAGTFFRRRTYELAGSMDERFRVAMDYEYWMRIAKLRCRFGFIPKALAIFTYHEENVSTRLNDLRLQELMRVRRLYGPRILFLPKRWHGVFYRIMERLWQCVRLCLKLFRKI